MILITVLIMDLLAGMEFDIFVPSFPELQSQFHLSAFLVEALLSINFIGYCISLFVVGGLSDHYGRKPMILIGLILFIIGCLCCLLETNYWFLLIGRFMQGLGIAAPAILSFLIIADSYTIKQQQFIRVVNGG
jgi:DHA1 family bicyclomycin/chloramphenicol resistance-like MFS transporter